MSLTYMAQFSRIHSPKKWRGSRGNDYFPRNSSKKKLKPQKSKKYYSNKDKIIKIVKVFIVLCVIGSVLSGIVFVALLAYFGKDLPDPNKLINRAVAQSTKIYDRKGEHILYEIHGDENRTIIPLEDIPEVALWAVIALEDKDFYNKKYGLSINRTILAVFYYGWSKVTGRTFKLGGSGITQQLVKNAILTPEKTVSRKIKEWILTVQIERKFTKDEILQMYFNEIPYGSTAYGIESAARFYLGKSAKDLELQESALLAAIIQRPTYYSPYGNHKEELLKRKDLVLSLMEQQSYITEDQKNEAQGKKIEFKKKYEKISAPHFVFFVREFLTSYYGEKIVEQGGLEVITTLDYDLQEIAENAVKNNIEKVERFGGENAALLAMDTNTGDILAMVGSRDYFDMERDGNVNVTLMQRQPGSSFKPIVYAAAFIKGFTPETLLYDVETLFKTETGDDYLPHNYDLKEHGPVTIRKALAGSLNIPAVKAIYLTGVNNVLDLADNLGYTTLKDRSRFGLSLVLGGGEVTLLEHLTAYSAFAQEGLIHYQRSILEIKNSDGKVIDKFPVKKKRVMDKTVARQINSILSDNEARSYVFGLNSPLTLGDIPVAVKTGTTNDYKDAWTIGYTPNLIAGVWVGNNDNKKMKTGAAGGVIASPIWNEFMREALKDKDVEKFEDPPENKEEKKVLKGEETELRIIEIDKISGKLATSFTPKDLIIRKVFRVHHSILHYLNKDDPKGEPPSDQELADPAYKLFEEGIQNWLVKEAEKGNEEEGDEKEELPKTERICSQGIIEETREEGEICEEIEILYVEPPLEYDDVHTPENKPSVRITSPAPGETIESSEILVTAESFAPRGVFRVEYYLEDELIGNLTDAPYSMLYLMQDKSNGFYTLNTRVYDDVENMTEASVNFNYLRNKSALTIIWLGPKDKSVIDSSAFPIEVNLLSSRYSEIKKVDIFGQKIMGNRFLIGTILSPQKSIISFSWIEPSSPGTYILSAKVLMSDDSNIQIPNINIDVKDE